jgi:HAD superfamily hydrolase (TIGR01484 family)
MRPIGSLTRDEARAIRFALMDIDDTITENGRVRAESYSSLWQLRESGFIVIPITGRPAGWCDLIAREWPVHGVVGENGAFAFYLDGNCREEMYHPEAKLKNTAPVFSRMRDTVFEEVPGSRIAKDQFCRLFDMAFDFSEEPPILPLSAAIHIKSICEEFGAKAKISSIHVNAWFGNYDKLSMTELFLKTKFGYRPETDAGSVIFFGDSPNDEPMFARFPISCGVSDLERYGGTLSFFPGFITKARNAAGFSEGVNRLLKMREN